MNFLVFARVNFLLSPFEIGKKFIKAYVCISALLFKALL